MSLPSPTTDRTAVVTGASSGIGAEIARELARRGHGVTLVARRAERLASLAEELSRLGVRAEVLPADLADPAARAGLLDGVAALGLVPHVLVNNAGLSTTGPVAAADPERELHMVEVNIAALVDLTTRFLPGMVERAAGRILNVASTAAFQPLPGQSAYGASKAFVLSYTRGLAAELRGTGVKATALCPGPVHTEFGAVAGFEGNDAESALPKIMWEPAEDVARVGVDALAAGRVVAIPGTVNRIGANLSHLTPKRWLAPVLAKGHPALRKARSR